MEWGFQPISLCLETRVYQLTGRSLFFFLALPKALAERDRQQERQQIKKIEDKLADNFR